MIKLDKGVKPQILIDNETTWTDEYLRLRNGDEDVPDAAKYRYRHVDIKAGLRDETHDKCAYCESKIQHVALDHIEHIAPQSLRPALVVSWENLTIACPECNRHKSNHLPDNENFVNPYVEDPDDHFIFVGISVFVKNESMNAKLTKNLLRLNREHLLDKRLEKLQEFQLLYDLWLTENSIGLKTVYREQVDEFCLEEKEYSAMIFTAYKLLFDE